MRTTIAPSRGTSAFGETEYVTIVVAVPDEPDMMWTHGTVASAVQAQPDEAMVTVEANVPPSGGTV